MLIRRLDSWLLMDYNTSMLMQLNNKRQKIASGILSLFMGGWLLLLCQTCLASTNDVKSHHESSSEISNPCHVLAENVQEANKSADDEHCLGVCDCDAITMALSSDKNSELREKIKYSPDLYSYISPEIIISTRAPPSYRIYTIPERAILLPLHTYNVLLI